jgi:hypothetical protein
MSHRLSRSPISTLWRRKSLEIRDKTADISFVSLGDYGTLTQFTLTLGRLFGQNMAGKSLVPANLAGAGFAKALGGTAIGFNLGHGKYLLKGITRHTENRLKGFGAHGINPVKMPTGIWSIFSWVQLP